MKSFVNLYGSNMDLDFNFIINPCIIYFSFLMSKIDDYKD